ncbi:MAG: iron-sulfur cluster assembly accessory protein [Polyangiaceae bacterium]|nr:iron-sulfur cluster assembly accessory protein [Polyangiaceae bacterium]
MLALTDKAAEMVQKIATEEEDLKWQGLRIKVVGGGCAGFSYDLYFEDTVGEMDEEYVSHGIKMYVDPISNQYLEATEIDYIETATGGGGFKFNNPNVKNTCGCGSSVSF